MKKIITREEKLKLISDFKQSGLTTTAFAKEQELNLATFRSWLYKKSVQEEQTKVHRFIEIQNTVRTTSSSIRILKNGIEIIIPLNLGIVDLQNILQAVHSL